ncbi:hypothetical protein BXZ70DRAFT_888084 [Cristinia sonorae]|uniref:F-box domain-containing protein n=1 Tax=Cristinia sonorae TaxID=1940300 RepID=A0A8K0UWQ9_9AGAR|nr:hypothetical protein BXZ70DRAFT_888084 [Cristinia sonorae]
MTVPLATELKCGTANPLVPPKDRCIINELPAELLSLIFVLGLDLADEDWDDDGTGSDSDSDFNGNPVDWQILVSSVCRRWREVALEVPQLWSEVVFTEKSTLEQAQTYLQRSKEAPLKIFIDYTNSESQTWPYSSLSELEDLMDRFKRMLTLLRMHLKHVAELEVMVTLWKYMGVLLEFLGSCDGAPMLEVLELYHYEDEDDLDNEPSPSSIPESDKQQNFVLFKGDIPRLKQVALWGVHVDWEKSLFLKNLAVLELAYHEPELSPSFKSFARILRSSPNLVTLTISQSGPRGGPVEWLQSITDGTDGVDIELSSVDMQIELPKVEEFVLAFVDCQYAIDLMDRLIFTNLSRLTLDFEEGDFTDFISSLVKPHRVTGKSILSTLTYFRLGGLRHCRKQVLDEMVETMQNVVSLHINFHFLASADWYIHLTPKPGDKVQFPRLEELHSVGLVGSELIKLVTARRAAGVPLLRLFVSEDDDMDPEEEKWLKEESGLKAFDTFENSEDEDEDEGLVELSDEEDFEGEFYDEDMDEDEDDDDDFYDDEDDDEEEDEEHGVWIDID